MNAILKLVEMTFLFLVMFSILSFEANATPTRCSFLFQKSQQHLNTQFSDRWFVYDQNQSLVGLHVTFKVVNSDKNAWSIPDNRSFLEKLSAWPLESVMESISGGKLKVNKNVLLNENGEKVQVYQVNPDYSGVVIAQSSTEIIIRIETPHRSRSKYIIFDQRGGGGFYDYNGGYSYNNVSIANHQLIFQVDAKKSSKVNIEEELSIASNYPLLDSKLTNRYLD